MQDGAEREEGAEMPVGDKAVGKYLEFTELDHGDRKTKVFSVYGRGTNINLGIVKFRPQWKCYVFVPEPGTLFDVKCLNDVVSFLSEQNQEWRKKHL